MANKVTKKMARKSGTGVEVEANYGHDDEEDDEYVDLELGTSVGEKSGSKREVSGDDRDGARRMENWPMARELPRTLAKKAEQNKNRMDDGA